MASVIGDGRRPSHPTVRETCSALHVARTARVSLQAYELARIEFKWRVCLVTAQSNALLTVCLAVLALSAAAECKRHTQDERVCAIDEHACRETAGHH
jgi:hypothetical protein